MKIFRQNILITAIIFLVMLSGCSYRGGNAYLPQRNGIEAGENVTVSGNENIYTIAREHNVSMRELIVLNGLKPPFEVKPGQSLTLPATGASFNGEMKAPSAAPLDAVEKTSLAPIEPAAVTSAPLALPSLAPASTNLSAPSQAPTSLAPINLPPAATPPVPAGGALTTPSLSPQSLNAAKASLVAAVPTEPVKALNQPSQPQKQVATTLAPLTGSVAAASAGATSSSGDDDAPVSMKWPVQGPILSTFGSKGEGLSNDGVNIGAPKGSPVVAAATGTVVYAGNEMKGFGNLVLIRHHGDWVTAYAHLDRVLVKKDSIVAQGDEIGTVGKTGNVPSPQLHFEIRQGGKAVDPSTIIKADS